MSYQTRTIRATAGLPPLPTAGIAPLLVAVLALLPLTGCASGARTADPGAAPTTGSVEPRVVQPGAPGEATRVLTDVGVPEATGAPHTEADVRFMQDMLRHHAQALVMTDLVAERAGSEGVRLLAHRIELSQQSEIELMRDWLEDRGEPVPEVVTEYRDGFAAGNAAHMQHMPRMAGMASPEELARLAASEGVAFDRLFLELMIDHHRGAIVMVDRLLESGEGGHEPELFQFLSHIDADQRAEIARMQRMLDPERDVPLQRDPV